MESLRIEQIKRQKRACCVDSRADNVDDIS